MPLLESLQDAVSRVLPEKKPTLPMPMSTTGGIGNTGMLPFEDDVSCLLFVGVARRAPDAPGCGARDAFVAAPSPWLRNVHVLSTSHHASMATSAETGWYLVFLLFIPILWTLWIWMIVSKPSIIFHASQSFFNFLAMCCFASVAAFQAKWKVGPSGLTGFALFISVIGLLFPLFLLFVPVVYEKYNKGARLARALSELRVSFILTGTGTAISLLISFIVTISAWTEPGCKNADNDPHEKLGDSFKNGLSGWCATKKAGAVFFWLAFGFWLASLILTIMNWRSGKVTRPRDQPFTHPAEFSEVASHEGDEYGDEESQYHMKPSYNSHDAHSPFADTPYTPPSFPAAPAGSYNAPGQPRPSIDAYGAFSDPPPSGFGAPGTATPPSESPRVSRTMQYADPYAAVRATVAAGQRTSAAPSNPPMYSSYSGY
ncbi:uncharacterized protein B0H18DRAFT_995381 [Fomitopsis serialis]|uniref:uncharacterized protein n=1 Tax=Fomitopsis serialis TaxID=139415 RepID=UPI00200815E2|nr:uncharacterized protein B0H18DRAFT_995381 [Neoantrodia serialis]KAH9930139.1 hypothetical protein B0H18DRAFT_995381 [Neoantrodia serialis]